MICTRCEHDGAGLRFETEGHGTWWFHARCWIAVRWAMAHPDGVGDFLRQINGDRRSRPVIAKDETIVIENEAKVWDSSVEPAERANARPTLTTTLPHEVRHGMAISKSTTGDD